MEKKYDTIMDELVPKQADGFGPFSHALARLVGTGEVEVKDKTGYTQVGEITEVSGDYLYINDAPMQLNNVQTVTQGDRVLYEAPVKDAKQAGIEGKASELVDDLDSTATRLEMHGTGYSDVLEAVGVSDKLAQAVKIITEIVRALVAGYKMGKRAAHFIEPGVHLTYYSAGQMCDGVIDLIDADSTIHVTGDNGVQETIVEDDIVSVEGTSFPGRGAAKRAEAEDMDEDSLRENAMSEGYDAQDIAEARALGKRAFEQGRKAVPAWDAELMKMLEGSPIGGGGQYLLQAWSDGWNEANIAADVPGVKENGEWV